MPLVSILVPVYNVERYLSRCLDSLVAQTYKDIEIIIINDGSTDNSRDIALLYSKRFNNIYVYDYENAGISTTRNRALYACNFYVIKPNQFTFNKSIDILVMVVFGGMGSMTSSVIAAIVIGIINMVLANFSEIRMIIYGLALVAIMIFKPTGLLGQRELSFKKLFASRKGDK